MAAIRNTATADARGMDRRRRRCNTSNRRDAAQVIAEAVLNADPRRLNPRVAPRTADITRAVARSFPELDDRDHRRVAALVRIFISVQTWLRMREEFGIDGGRVRAARDNGPSQHSCGRSAPATYPRRRRVRPSISASGRARPWCRPRASPGGASPSRARCPCTTPLRAAATRFSGVMPSLLR